MLLIHVLRGHLFLVQVLKVVRIRAFVHMLYGQGHLFLVQVLKVVRTCAFVHMLCRHGHLLFDQVIKVIYTCVFVHMHRDLDTCCLFKCLRSSIHVHLYTCIGIWTLVVCSST
jgi:hypothetical protein